MARIEPLRRRIRAMEGRLGVRDLSEPFGDSWEPSREETLEMMRILFEVGHLDRVLRGIGIEGEELEAAKRVIARIERDQGR